MPDTLAVLVTAAALERRPALPGFLARKVIASGRTTERARLVETCRAELAWSVADWIRLSGTGANHDARYDGPHPAEPHRLPHERAAATVLNVWGHLHPIERSIHDLTRRPNGRLRTQRQAAAADRYTESQRYDWARRAEATLDDLRWHLSERRKLMMRLTAAVAHYRAARAVSRGAAGTRVQVEAV
ncbi:hypothetical protein BH10PSE6_BH10PSE6_38640 [soil metagenome]